MAKKTDPPKQTSKSSPKADPPKASPPKSAPSPAVAAEKAAQAIAQKDQKEAHQNAINLMAEAQKTTNETEANKLISQAMLAAQQSGKNNATVFKAVLDHAQQIQARNVALRPSSTTPAPTSPAQPQVQPTSLRPPAPTPPVQQRQSIIKSPNKDVVNFQREEYSAASIARLLFEQVGSIELINIARRDTVEGQNPYYSLISNLSSIRKNFDPTSLISRQRVNETIFDNYTINLDSKIPDQDYLNKNNIENFYYIASNGDLVIELDNLSEDERIEVEIAQSGTINLVDEV